MELSIGLNGRSLEVCTVGSDTAEDVWGISPDRRLSIYKEAGANVKGEWYRLWALRLGRWTVAIEYADIVPVGGST